MAKKIGEFLLDLGVLTEKQVGEILRYAKGTGMRFGEAAVRLGFLRNETPIKAFGSSFSVDFFHLKSEYFPQTTRDFLPPEMVMRLGALPLGMKTVSKFFREKKYINIGILDPTRKAAIAEIETLAREKLGSDYGGMHVYLVLADQFVEILDSVYRVSEADLRSRPADQTDTTLREFLESIAINPS
jgi:hypothetical protein